MALLAVGVFGAPLDGTPAGATSPQWQTTASFPPLANVSAISCAPKSGSQAQPLALQSDDKGNNVPSIIATDDGGSTWNSVTPPQGVIGFH